MAKTDDYLKRYNETNQNDLVKPAQTAGEDDYFKLAKEQEYGLLFDKEVALENAKANALKYTKNEINAQGFGGTGYGSSMQSGIYNSYLNRANEAKEQYADRIREIGVEERENALADANDRFQSVTTMVQGADTLENMNQVLTDYGYGSVDKDGNFVWNAEKPEGMSDDDWYQMQYYYRMKKNDFDASNSDTNVVNTLQGLQNMTFELQDNDTSGDKNHHAGTIGTLGEWFGEESKWLIHKANYGELEKDCVIKVTNGRGDVIYLKWDGEGYSQVNSQAYKTAENKHTLRHEDKKNYWD